MRKSRHGETEIVKTVNQLKNGPSADEVCREYGISGGTPYNWRKVQ